MALVYSNGIMESVSVNNYGGGSGGCDAVEIFGGRATGCQFASYDTAVVGASGSTLSQCDIYGTIGIDTTGGAATRVENCSVTGNGNTAILCGGNGGIITGCSIYLDNGTTGTNDAGIRVEIPTENKEGPMISNCVIRGSGANGIVIVSGDNVMITACRFDTIPDDCIRIDGSYGATVSLCKFQGGLSTTNLINVTANSIDAYIADNDLRPSVGGDPLLDNGVNTTLSSNLGLATSGSGLTTKEWGISGVIPLGVSDVILRAWGAMELDSVYLNISTVGAADVDVDILVNGVAVGTATVLAGDTEGTVAIGEVLSVGDLIQVEPTNDGAGAEGLAVQLWMVA
jgi:hypothetical protein